MDKGPLTFRIMTWNVHGCFGTDGKLSPYRVAKVIAQYTPDIVALQELDVKRARSGVVDQPHVIARDLRMYFHFHPALEVEEEKYGNAVLSRFEVQLMRAGPLPTLPRRTDLEQRSALWARIMAGEREINIINTHLGLNRMERLAQANALLGPDWIGDPGCRPPIIFCGDFNAGAYSPVYKKFRSRFRDAQLSSPAKSARGTFPSYLPLLRLDHIFLSGEFDIKNIEVPRTPLTARASDHLPLIAEISLEGV